MAELTCGVQPSPKDPLVLVVLELSPNCRKRAANRHGAELLPMRFPIFPLHLWKVRRLPRKSDARSYIQSAAPVTRNHLSKPKETLQNATPLKRSAPLPPNISDEHVSCIAPAGRNASSQILFKCPTLAIVFGNATKPSRFAHSWQGAESLAPATRNDILNVQKRTEHVVLLTF